MRDERQWSRLHALSQVMRARREHIEACMACTSGMGIAADKGSLDSCDSCQTLARITNDVSAEREYRERRARRLRKQKEQEQPDAD